MQTATEHSQVIAMPEFLPEASAAVTAIFTYHEIIRREGAFVALDSAGRAVAMIALSDSRGQRVALACTGGLAAQRAGHGVAVQDDKVLLRRTPSCGNFHIEDIQDQSEPARMRSGGHDRGRAVFTASARASIACLVAKRSVAPVTEASDRNVDDSIPCPFVRIDQVVPVRTLVDRRRAFFWAMACSASMRRWSGSDVGSRRRHGRRGVLDAVDGGANDSQPPGPDVRVERGALNIELQVSGHETARC